MGYQVKNFATVANGFATNNDDITIKAKGGPFSVVEYARDLSVNHYTAETMFFASKMGVHRRQVVCDLSKGGVIVQAGAMQWMLGNVNASSGIKGAGDLIGKMFNAKVTGETAVKPEYSGTGTLVLEPTYRHLLVLNTREFGGAMVLDDGMFLACQSNLKLQTVMRSNLSSAVAGGEGLFNLCLVGDGFAVCESNVPREELIEIELNNDELKVDGNFAVAWSQTLQFTVEKSTKSIIGSIASGEGLVNVYRGTGKVLLAPVGGQATSYASNRGTINN